MNYDAVAESRRLIEHGAPDRLVRLTRRRRWIPIAVDVDGDVAAAAFLRRGVSGGGCHDLWALERRDGDWELIGGSGGDGYPPELPDRPPAAELGAFARLDGSGWTRRDDGRLTPWGAQGVSTASLTVSAEVAHLRVDDRDVSVPRHGIAVVVWGTRRPPAVVALASDGTPLTQIPLPKQAL